jgi:hypothetical protein
VIAKPINDAKAYPVKLFPKFRHYLSRVSKIYLFSQKKQMKEEFLHFLWKYRLFISPLATTLDEPIEVLKPGVHNTDAGPDFVDARLRIGDTLWAGNVEIHTQASSWYEHKHDKDSSYDNVILHLVLNNDEPAKRTNGDLIPCLECDKIIPPALYDTYKDLMSSKLWIPCARLIKSCPEIIIGSWIETQLVERTAAKTAAIELILKATGNDWEETFYRLLARSFGLKINTLPFEMLAASLPYKILARHHDQAVQVDAMIFGQAGFLDKDYVDGYPAMLKKEYEFLGKKYSLQPLDMSVWKFLRLRPLAFPTIRLAQFSALLQSTDSLFSRVIETREIDDLRDLFRVKASEYWDTHYRFEKLSSDKVPRLIGEQGIDLLLINAVVPVLFSYGRLHQSDEFMTRAFDLLEALPPEQNATINKWKSLGIPVIDAFTSQALLHLKLSYCDHKKCLDCRIGNELLK